MQSLGEILAARNAAHREAVARALTLQQHLRVKLGAILSRYGLIPEREVMAALAEQAGLHYVLLSDAPPDAALFLRKDIEAYRAHRFIPWRRVAGVLTLASSDASDALKQWAEAYYGEKVALVVTPPRDLRHALRQRGRAVLTRDAIFGLTRRFRHLSAARTLTRRQMLHITLWLAVAAACLLLLPAAGFWFVLIVGANVFYLSTLAFKLYLYAVWRGLPVPVAAPATDEAELPPYAILVPLYQESAPTIRQLLRAIATLDYPPYLLDVKLICEEDDAATIQAVKEANPPEYCDLVRVPVSLPRTKPKACNVALADVCAEFVVIFDAEDIPAPDQLKKSVAAFRRLPREVACLQSPLNYYNRDENLLTRLFAIEYGVLFTLLLPALHALSIPLPLGGTSNHLRTDVLREVGGWDAFNVTEDADLGIRLSYFGYRTAVLDSLTLEESPITPAAWFKQRARWIKGYLQTWLVYTRDTRTLKARLGMVGYYGFHFFVGAPAITFLLAPFFWILFLVSVLGFSPAPLSFWLFWLCVVSLLGGILSHWLFARAILRAQGWRSVRMHRAGLLFPFYWLLHSVAAIRALRDLALRPHHWEKTRHGVSRVVRA